MSDPLLVFNGINGQTGDYLSLTLAQTSALARGQAELPDVQKALKRRAQELKAGAPRGPKAGVNAKNLAQAGWGVIFAAQDAARVAALKDALQPVLDLRRSQAGDFYREFDGRPGEDGHGDWYLPGDDKAAFLRRHGMGSVEAANPDKVPYYLLIVADPETIPYRFQYQLDVVYAVGRLHFDALHDRDDPLERYARYAQTVVEAETGKLIRPKRAAFFGVQNLDDVPTTLSRTQLVELLAQALARNPAGWAVDLAPPAAADKARLGRLLGDDAPALLFTASHGMVFPKDDPRQVPHQGALLCGDWPGPQIWRGKGAIPHDHYLAADDIGEDAQVAGLIAFHFACFGAGTPKLDDFPHLQATDPQTIAARAFVARLPQRLLGHPKGGALAVIGHVERTWGYAYSDEWQGTDRQVGTFESTLLELMQGCPVGMAMEFFNDRYAALAADLTEKQELVRYRVQITDEAMAGLWTAHNDARAYVVLGDPAVRVVPAYAGMAQPAMQRTTRSG